MTYQQLMDHFGSLSKAASALDIAVSTIQDWKASGIPHGKQCYIQIATAGVLQADPKQKAESRRRKAAAAALAER